VTYYPYGTRHSDAESETSTLAEVMKWVKTLPTTGHTPQVEITHEYVEYYINSAKILLRSETLTHHQEKWEFLSKLDNAYSCTRESVSIDAQIWRPISASFNSEEGETPLNNLENHTCDTITISVITEITDTQKDIPLYSQNLIEEADIAVDNDATNASTSTSAHLGCNLDSEEFLLIGSNLAIHIAADPCALRHHNVVVLAKALY